LATDAENAKQYFIRLIERLQALWPVHRPIDLQVVDDDHIVWSMCYSQTADGACNIRNDGITIYLRSCAHESEYWIDVLCHEYAHAVTAKILESAKPIIKDVMTPEAYHGDKIIADFELLASRLGGLLEYALRTGASLSEMNECKVSDL
jgi:hypothetical protein